MSLTNEPTEVAPVRAQDSMAARAAADLDRGKSDDDRVVLVIQRIR